MVNIKELRLGNQVYDSETTGFPMTVVGLFEDTIYLDFEENEGDMFEIDAKDAAPIPINQDNLIICGFEHNSDFTMRCELDGNKLLEFDIDTREFKFIDLYEIKHLGQVDYLHQLQNLVNDLLKTELDVKIS